jgi:hypothetical protein
MKHADGPWVIVPYGDGDSLVIHSDDANRVCFMATHGGSRSSWERIQANAALISAAPDLRDVLQRIVDARTIPSAEMYEAARAALAKADVNVSAQEPLKGEEA